ncbi:MAG: hypothetical protein WCJ64_08420 [Rhodospirillaceae bacterium]
MRNLNDIDADIAAVQGTLVSANTAFTINPWDKPSLALVRASNDALELLQTERASVVAANLTAPRDLGKLEFRALVIGVLGLELYQSVRSASGLFLANDTLALASVIRAEDMPAYWEQVIGAGLLVQGQVDAVMAAWPTNAPVVVPVVEPPAVPVVVPPPAVPTSDIGSFTSTDIGGLTTTQVGNLS